MLNNQIQSMGGKSTAKILKQKAYDNYYLNPNKCLCCDSVIHLKINQKCSDIRKKKFCNKSCAAIFNNKNRSKKIIQKEKKEYVRKKIMENRTKGDLFIKCTKWQNARSMIQKHARLVYQNSNKPKECYNCGYKTHYEVCHKKPVSSFDDSASIINEVNNINNLVALCPTHHWEFDNNILILK